jgi:hypothetical protein
VPVAISGSAIDGESGVGIATLRIVDEYGELSGVQDITSLLGADGSFSTTLDLSAVVRAGDADGRTYAISLTAADNFANEAAPVEVAVLVPPDTTPPTVSLDSPEPAQLPFRDPNTLKSVRISGTAVDAESGIQSALLSVADEYGEFDGQHDVTLNLDETGHFEITLQLSSRIKGGAKDGRVYDISLVATDLAGNTSAVASVQVFAQRPSSGGNPGPPGHAGGGDTPPGHDKRPDNPNRRGR